MNLPSNLENLIHKLQRVNLFREDRLQSLTNSPSVAAIRMKKQRGFPVRQPEYRRAQDPGQGDLVLIIYDKFQQVDEIDDFLRPVEKSLAFDNHRNILRRKRIDI